MSFAVAKTIATALVSSRLDYCNSLYHNIGLNDILKLLRVQNCLSRVVTLSPHFSHSVLLLKSLHCLPIRYRIIFKICAITYLNLFNLLILHSPPPSPSVPIQLFTMELLIDYELLNPFCFGALPSLGLPRILLLYY